MHIIQCSAEHSEGEDHMYRSEQEMISRIMQHEMLLERAEQVIGQMETALDAFEGIRRDMQTLEGYYTSPEWKSDYAADEAGMLPDGMKRGVLSQDGIDHLLERYAELNDRMTEFRNEIR